MKIELKQNNGIDVHISSSIENIFFMIRDEENYLNLMFLRTKEVIEAFQQIFEANESVIYVESSGLKCEFLVKQNLYSVPKEFTLMVNEFLFHLHPYTMRKLKYIFNNLREYSEEEKKNTNLLW